MYNKGISDRIAAPNIEGYSVMFTLFKSSYERLVIEKCCMCSCKGSCKDAGYNIHKIQITFLKNSNIIYRHIWVEQYCDIKSGISPKPTVLLF